MSPLIPWSVVLLFACPRPPLSTPIAFPDVVIFCGILKSADPEVIRAEIRGLGWEPVSLSTTYGSSVEVVLAGSASRATFVSLWGPGTELPRLHYDSPYSVVHTPASVPDCRVFADGNEDMVTHISVRRD